MSDNKDDKQESSPGSSLRSSSKRQDHSDRRSLSPPLNVIREDVRYRLRDRPSNNDALDAAHWLHSHGNPGENDNSAQSLPVSSPRRSPRSRLAWTSYVNEGAELIMPRLTPDARVQSPRRDRSRNNSDGDNENNSNNTAAEDGRTTTRRPPSLERQEAFLALGTSTTRQRGSNDSRAVVVDDNTEYNVDGFEAIEAEDDDNDGIDNYNIAPDADELAYDHDDGLADDLGFVEVPDASGYPDLVYDSDLSDEDDGRSSSGWVVMRDSSERVPAVRAQ
ncbi:hypothetical protein MAPG_09175 [Magnaporthiopsis poae ATCC 64411]|uniref:Uncharacterized protein n=1 Tax=Magnaporthiopsis poae (strain ATCC 64411 / 73-15) TaxID=644358 RepID=A0A0C4E996_MAGP6|nr:hypothetical protein MAPG_09175 [Magnaporthiopsis poae ATCC 64411]